MDSEDCERKARKGCQETCSRVYTMNLRRVTPYLIYNITMDKVLSFVLFPKYEVAETPLIYGSLKPVTGFYDF
jgi:hypothetical protein